MARPRPRLIATVPMLLILGGCFTTTLWGGEMRSRTDPVTGEVRPAAQLDPAGDGSDASDGMSVWAKIALTPFTLLLDCVTCPVQAIMYGWDDDVCDR